MDSVISRSRWILVIIIGALCLCGVRLVQLQIVEGPVLAAQGQRVRTSRRTMPPWSTGRCSLSRAR